jgi:hypothetical protein
VAVRSSLVWRCPAKSKYVHQAPKPTTTATSPTLTVRTLTGWLASPLTTPVRVSPSTMMMSSPNRSMSASVTLIASASAGTLTSVITTNPAR